MEGRDELIERVGLHDPSVKIVKGTKDFALMQNPAQKYCLLNLIGQNGAIKSGNRRQYVRVLGFRASSEDIAELKSKIEATSPQTFFKVEASRPILAARDAGKVPPQSHDAKIQRLLDRNKAKRLAERKETIENARKRRMGRVTKTTAMKRTDLEVLRAKIAQTFRDRKLCDAGESESKDDGSYGHDQVWSSVATATASASAPTQSTLPVVRREHETRLQNFVLVAIVPDWEVLDEQEAIIAKYEASETAEYTSRCNELYETHCKERGVSAELSEAEIEDLLEEWLENNPATWTVRYNTTKAAMYRQATKFWEAEFFETNSEIPADWKIPDLPSDKKITIEFNRAFVTEYTERTGNTYVDPQEYPEPPKTRVDKCKWYIQHLWRKTHPRHKGPVPRMHELHTWYETMERNKARRLTVPRPPTPPEEVLLDSSRYFPSRTEDDEGNPLTWIGWLNRNPPLPRLFWPEFESIKANADDTELQSWLRSRDLAVSEHKWLRLGMDVPDKFETLCEWYFVNQPPLPSEYPTEECVIVPIMSFNSEPEAQKWMTTIGNTFECLADVDVAVLPMYEEFPPDMISNVDLPNRVWRDEAQNQIMNSALRRAASVRAHKATNKETNVVEIYDNKVVHRVEAPERTEEDDAFAKQSAMEIQSKIQEAEQKFLSDQERHAMDLYRNSDWRTAGLSSSVANDVISEMSKPAAATATTTMTACDDDGDGDGDGGDVDEDNVVVVKRRPVKARKTRRVRAR